MKLSMESKPSNHAKTRLRYHLIFSTKYRRDVLNPIRDEVISCFKNIADRHHFKIYAIEVDKNHIHFLIEFSPDHAISKVVKLFKQISFKNLWEKHENYLKKFYWKRKYLWTHGYFCATIGNVSEEAIKCYILNQG